MNEIAGDAACSTACCASCVDGRDPVVLPAVAAGGFFSEVAFCCRVACVWLAGSPVWFGFTLSYQPLPKPMPVQNSSAWQEMEEHAAHGGQTTHCNGQASDANDVQFVPVC